MRRATGPFRSLLLFAVGGVASIFVMELALHLIEATPAWRVLPVVERELGWPDYDQGYAMRPNRQIIWMQENRAIVTTNAFGLRDRATVRVKAPSLTRVALTGDSYTEALQVGDTKTYEAIAERNLNKGGSAPTYEILNVSLGGANPLRQYLQLVHHGLQFEPDIAVFAMGIADFLADSMGNDTEKPGYVLDENGEIVIGYRFRDRRSIRLKDEPIGKVFFWLMDHSRLALALMTRYRKGVWQYHAPVTPTAGPVRPPCEVKTELLHKMTNLWRDGRPQPQASYLERFLLDVGKLREKHDMKVVFMFRGIGLPMEGCLSNDEARAEFVRVLVDRLASHGITMFDVDSRLVVLAGSAEEVRKLFGFGSKVGGGHLNERGHELYAEILTTIVREQTSQSRP